VEALGAADLEELAWLLVSILEGRDELLLRGHDERGNFIKGITDAFSECGTVAVECGAGAGYFSGGLDKPIADAKHALHAWPNLKRLYLVSTQTVPPSKWQKLLTRLAESVGGNVSVGVVSEGVEIHNRKTRVFDATRIAGYLFESLSSVRPPDRIVTRSPIRVDIASRRSVRRRRWKWQGLVAADVRGTNRKAARRT
jgi:hypothetical protein